MDKAESAQVRKGNCSIVNNDQNWECFQSCLVFVNTVVHLKIIKAVVFAHEWQMRLTVSAERRLWSVGVLWPFQAGLRVQGVYQLLPSGGAVEEVCCSDGSCKSQLWVLMPRLTPSSFVLHCVKVVMTCRGLDCGKEQVGKILCRRLSTLTCSLWL